MSYQRHKHLKYLINTQGEEFDRLDIETGKRVIDLLHTALELEQAAEVRGSIRYCPQRHASIHDALAGEYRMLIGLQMEANDQCRLERELFASSNDFFPEIVEGPIQ